MHVSFPLPVALLRSGHSMLADSWSAFGDAGETVATESRNGGDAHIEARFCLKRTPEPVVLNSQLSSPPPGFCSWPGQHPQPDPTLHMALTRSSHTVWLAGWLVGCFTGCSRTAAPVRVCCCCRCCTARSHLCKTGAALLLFWGFFFFAVQTTRRLLFPE